MLRMGRHNVIPSIMQVRTFAPRTAAAAGNGLLNALIAYWPGNEASGNLIDAHTNGLNLTDTNTVTNNTGIVYATARQYTRTNTEYHTYDADSALLSTGDVDYTLAAWIYLDSKTADMYGPNKWITATANREYGIVYAVATDRLRWQVSYNGTNSTLLLANSLGSPSLATWYFVIGWHDSVANKIYVQVNNGTVDEADHANGFDSTAPFQVGSLAATTLWNGRIGPTMFWKSAAGSGGVLSAAQRTALYNAGAGLTYAAFTT